MFQIVAQKNGSKLNGTVKDYMLRVRMDVETVQQLDECCKKENATRSEVVRDLIREKHAEIKK